MSHQKKLYPFDVTVVSDATEKSEIVVSTTQVMAINEDTAKMEGARLAATYDVNEIRVFVRPFC
jgi:hypothetical protein